MANRDDTLEAKHDFRAHIGPPECRVLQTRWCPGEQWGGTQWGSYLEADLKRAGALLRSDAIELIDLQAGEDVRGLQAIERVRRRREEGRRVSGIWSGRTRMRSDGGHATEEGKRLMRTHPDKRLVGDSGASDVKVTDDLAPLSASTAIIIEPRARPVLPDTCASTTLTPPRARLFPFPRHLLVRRAAPSFTRFVAPTRDVTLGPSHSRLRASRRGFTLKKGCY